MERFSIRPVHEALASTRDSLLSNLRALLPGCETHEVGATAIPGCVGKGDLDLFVRAPADRFDAARAALDTHFTRDPKQLSTPIYQGYRVDAPFDAAIQLTVADGPHDDFLPFKRALTTDPALRDAYNALKRAWNGRDMDEYRTAKGAFVRGVLDGPGPLPDACDVAVIGGSLAGVATALFLAREGVDVVLLEAAPFVGHNTSGRSLGPVERSVVEHPHRTIRALGERMPGLLEFTARNRDLLAAEGLFEPGGVLWVALQDGERSEIPKSVEALGTQGIPAEAWTVEQVEQRTGAPLGPALYLPEDGSIDAFGALHTLLERAREAGVKVHTQAPASIDDTEPLTLRIQAGSPAAPNGIREETLCAELVVIAAGAGSGALDARLDAGLTPVRDQALLTAPFEHTPHPFSRAGQGWTAWRTHPSGGVVVSGARWATPHMEVGETDANETEPRVQARLEAFLRDRLGVDAPVVDRWAWVFANTRDGLPIIGPLPGQPRRIAAVGFGANPASSALAAARSVADGILGDGPPLPPLLSSRRLVRWRLG